VRYLLESEQVVKVTSELLYTKERWEEVVARVSRHLTDHPTLTMSDFKNLLQVSRKYSIPVLEHLDRTGLTRREGDSRILGPKLKN
jgi:selenocysteine-specific elongation factor